MVSLFHISILLLLSILVNSAPLNVFEDYNYYDDSTEDFIEKDSCTILVRIDSLPSTFFSLLHEYINEVSISINRTTAVARIDDQDQIFVGVNESRRIITEKDASSSEEIFVEVLLETDLFECFNEEHLINSINQARKTFSSVSVIGFLISDPSTTANSISPIAEFLIGIGCCIAIIVVVVVVTVQKRRSPKKRTHTESATTVVPDYDYMPNGIPLKNLNSSPAAKRPPPPPSLPPPLLPTRTLLHDLALGKGPIQITEPNKWMVSTRDGNGCTPLHCVAVAPYDKKSSTQTEVDARCLIENGADVNAQDNRGNTPLHLSISHLRSSLSNILLKEKTIDVSIVNNEEKTFLHIAASINDFIVLDPLLSSPNAKKILNMTDIHNYTPLVINIRNCYSDTIFIRKLLAAGADPNYPGDEVFDHNKDDQFNRERTALHYAAQLGLNEHVKVLTELGANANAHDSRRRSPLHYAVENLKLSTIQLLISIGADMGIHDQNDQTPVDLAKQMGYAEAVAIFQTENTRRKEQANRKRRRVVKDENDKKRRRSSTDTGYKSSSPIRNLEDDEQIVDTPSRVVQPHPNQLFPQPTHFTDPAQIPQLQTLQHHPIPNVPQYVYMNDQYVQYNDYQFYEDPNF